MICAAWCYPCFVRRMASCHLFRAVLCRLPTLLDMLPAAPCCRCSVLCLAHRQCFVLSSTSSPSCSICFHLPAAFSWFECCAWAQVRRTRICFFCDWACCCGRARRMVLHGQATLNKSAVLRVAVSVRCFVGRCRGWWVVLGHCRLGLCRLFDLRASKREDVSRPLDRVRSVGSGVLQRRWVGLCAWAVLLGCGVACSVIGEVTVLMGTGRDTSASWI